jgi:hypothetical protein
MKLTPSDIKYLNTLMDKNPKFSFNNDEGARLFLYLYPIERGLLIPRNQPLCEWVINMNGVKNFVKQHNLIEK